MSDSDSTIWPADCGAMGERIRNTDWSATRLGAIETWPRCLKSAIDILLRLPMPGILSWGNDGILIYNDACAAFSETLHPNLLGCALYKCWPDNKSFKENMSKVFREGIAFSCPDQEVTLYEKSGPRRAWLNINYSPVPDQHGNTAGVLALFIETTERMQAEHALRDSERHFSTIFTRAQVGLSVISQEGRFQRVNDRLCQMFGRSRETMLTLGVKDVTHPDDLANTIKVFTHLITTGEPVSIDKRYVRPDGSVVFANSSASRLDDWYDHHPMALVVTIDLTERKLAEEALMESEARFRALADAAPALIWQFDPTGSAVYMNPRFLSLVGIAPEKLLGAGWKSIVHPDDVEECLKQLAEAQREMRATQRRMRIRCADGEYHWMKSHAAPWFSANGQYAGHVVISVDINDAVRAQEELLVSNERLNLAIAGSGDGVWDWDMQTNEITCSARTQEILGLGEQETLRKYEDWERRVHPEDLPAVLAEVRACLDKTRPTLNVEYRARAHDGSWRWAQARAIAVMRDGQAVRMTGTLTDISEKRRSEEIVWHYANFDALTNLPNRRLFRDRLDHEVRKAQRTGLPLALLFIDLDRFKEANDLLGHDVGDQLLIEAARRIRSCVRKSDTVARLGGDEFTAILTELDDLAHVEPVAQKINDALSAPFRIGSEVVYLSASIGITLYPNDAANAEHLIRNADQAMYVAKNGGRNQFSYFTSFMQREAHDRLRLIGDLRKALDAGQLRVYYQPVIDLASGRIAKAEALLRWQHPRLGMLEPMRFISFAEEAGLITEIGNWVFEEAANCSLHWGRRLGSPFQISVNKSPVQFLSRSKGVNWPDYLKHLGLSGDSISVEITEGVLLNASSAVADKLLQYRDAGIQVAIDDFGTGYSSMAYLKRFDIDYLKIDQSFIHDMATSESDRAIVRSVTAMAHELGLQVIAEGIETAEQKELLLDANCDFGQGFLFSKAVPAEEFERVLCA